MYEDLLRHQKLKPECLKPYGFSKSGDIWEYDVPIRDGEFLLHVFVYESGKIDTSLTEIETGEEYVLYKTNAAGTYVGEVRKAALEKLTGIISACYETSIFKSKQALMLIEYVRETYGDELEFLWTKFPENAIWRRKDNGKWYGAILTVIGNKIGLDTDKIVEIIDLRMKPDDAETMLARENYYPGWHMNKKNWYTIVLDGGVPNDELRQRITESYDLAAK